MKHHIKPIPANTKPQRAPRKGYLSVISLWLDPLWKCSSLFLLCTLSINSTAHAAEIRTVALSGQQVPGAPEGTVFTGFSDPPVLNDAGQTAFQGGGGILSEGSGSLELVAATGQQAPGMPDGVTYESFPSPGRLVINDAGTTVFPAFHTLIGSASRGSGIWSSGPGGSALVALSGEQVAGAPAGVVYFVDPICAGRTLLANDAGQVAFQAILTGSGVAGRGILVLRHGNLELVARTSTHAPGTPDGVHFSDVSGSPLSLNNLGQTAFSGMLTGSGVNSTNNVGLWSEVSGSLALVARKGSQAPGMPDGAVFNPVFSFVSSDLNNAGQTAFLSPVTGGGVDSTNNRGIWLETSGSLALVARSGSPAPGTSGLNFGGFTHIALNDAGQIAFSGADSSGRSGLWSSALGGLALVARSGDRAPGTEDGVVFASLITPGSDRAYPTLNAAGQTAFFGALSGSGISASNDLGIWATDQSGAVQLIAREGNPVQVAPGDFRTVGELRFLTRGLTPQPTGNSDGRPSAFNNLGQLAFMASFTDGTSGIFVSNRVAVPEPSAMLLTALAAAGLSWRRRVRERLT